MLNGKALAGSSDASPSCATPDKSHHNNVAKSGADIRLSATRQWWAGLDFVIGAANYFNFNIIEVKGGGAVLIWILLDIEKGQFRKMCLGVLVETAIAQSVPPRRIWRLVAALKTAYLTCVFIISCIKIMNFDNSK